MMRQVKNRMVAMNYTQELGKASPALLCKHLREHNRTKESSTGFGGLRTRFYPGTIVKHCQEQPLSNARNNPRTKLNI